MGNEKCSSSSVQMFDLVFKGLPVIINDISSCYRMLTLCKCEPQHSSLTEEGVLPPLLKATLIRTEM